jgi:hypothetical protein
MLNIRLKLYASTFKPIFALTLGSRRVPVESPAAYWCAGGLAVLLAQCFYGAQLKSLALRAY